MCNAPRGMSPLPVQLPRRALFDSNSELATHAMVGETGAAILVLRRRKQNLF
jgi:hypothetical protein